MTTNDEGTPSEASEARFPVRDPDELVALLGADVPVTIKGRTLPAAQAKDAIPPYYFPIHSPADLGAKLGDLGAPGFVDERDAFEQWRDRMAAADDPPPAGGWS